MAARNDQSGGSHSEATAIVTIVVISMVLIGIWMLAKPAIIYPAFAINWVLIKIIQLTMGLGQTGQNILAFIEATLKDYPDIKVLEQKTANWSRAEALSLVENWLTAHPDEIQGIIGENDEMAIGALEAVKAHGLDPKKIPVAGVDGVTDALLAVQRGEMMSTLQDADAQAQGAIDLALGVVRGADYKPQAKVWDVNGGQLAWDGGKQQQYSVPWVPVTGENVEALLAMRKTQ